MASANADYIWFEWNVPTDSILYRNLLGIWGVYVFAYEASYPSRPSANATNAVGYAFDSFQITPLSPTPASSSLQTNLSFGLQALNVIASFAGAWFLVYPSVKANWEEIRKLGAKYLVPIALVVVALVIDYFLWIVSR